MVSGTPVALTLKVAVAPAVTVKLVGWVRIVRSQLRRPAVEPVCDVGGQRDVRVTRRESDAVAQGGQRAQIIRAVEVPVAEFVGWQGIRVPAADIGADETTDEHRVAVGDAAGTSDNIGGIRAGQGREPAIDEGEAVAADIARSGRRVRAERGCIAGANEPTHFAIGEEQIAAAPDEVHVALDEAVIEVRLARGDVGKDGILSAVDIAVVDDVALRPAFDHQGFGLRKVLGGHVGQCRGHQSRCYSR